MFLCLLKTFGVAFILHCILEVKFPQNPHFWCRNRPFQAKHAKIFKLSYNQSHCSDSNLILHIYKDLQILFWVIPKCAPQIQDGGRPPSKSKKLCYLQRDRARHLSGEILQLQNISLENPIVWHYLRDSKFSRFDTIPECDRHTHRQTDRHTTTAHTAVSIVSRGNRPYCTAHQL